MIKRGFPAFDAGSRLLLIAPHPDDETLGCGIALQRAIRAGAKVRVVYVTDGDNNPWPQRIIERKWRLNSNDRHRWGALRRAEALAALEQLGVAPSDAHFLGLPDQGLTGLLTNDCRPVLNQLGAVISECSPTHLLIPSIVDRHPDHNALAVMLRLVLDSSVVIRDSISVWSYAIHGDSPAFAEQAVEDQQSPAENAAKMRAIRCHDTQLRLSRRRFLRYAARPERFAPVLVERRPLIDGGVRAINRNVHGLQVEFDCAPSRPRQLFLCGRNQDGSLRSVAINCPNGNGQIRIPIDGFSNNYPLFVKTVRKSLRFFDEAGWIEVPPVPTGPPTPLTAVDTSSAQSVTLTSASELEPEKSISETGGFIGRRWPWLIAFGAVLVWLGFALSQNINRPWIGAGLDYNGAVWSQSAHNILRAGLGETSGASSGFYFGPLPIPAWGYYLHHPPLLHLIITGLFYIFGEHEWVARLLPIGCSLVSAILLWVLVRSCAGIRAATLAAAVFAFLPMELRYGKMVNFEPVVLMLILGALVCLRHWSLTGFRGWQYGSFACVLVGLWVDWAMYLFVGSLAVCWLVRPRETRRFAFSLVAIAILSALLYLIRIQQLRPDAWENLTHTLIVRLGSSGTDRFTEWQWIERVSQSLLVHFLPLGWILASAGAWYCFRVKKHDPNLAWLFRACLTVFVMDTLFVGLFQNDSYIHQYISFYFVAPIAMMAGLALDRMIVVVPKIFAVKPLARAAEISVCALLLLMAVQGTNQTRQLQHQFYILNYRTPEPPNLIPELGEAIQKHFPPEACVLCNFLPEYGPQFAYYAQRQILNNLSEYRFWQPHLKDSNKLVGGVVWMTPKNSRDLLSKLPPGTKQFFKVGDLSFCLWKRQQIATKDRLGKL